MGSVGEVRQLPAGRDIYLDERGQALRLTWHPERGIVNVSMWRDDRCVETFRLPIGDVARLVGFLVDGLGSAAAGAGAAETA